MKICHILLIDDDEITAYAFQRYIESHGYTVTVAYDAETALKIVDKIKVDCLITDYRLGGMNGVELIGKLREVQPELPALVVSAYTDEIKIDDPKTQILRKPVSLELLVRGVQEVLSNA